MNHRRGFLVELLTDIITWAVATGFGGLPSLADKWLPRGKRKAPGL
jgi:hypothetical protein